jgi:hypothetical protein
LTSLTENRKLGIDEKDTELQSQIKRSFDIPIQQISIPKPPPLLEFKIQKDVNIKNSYRHASQPLIQVFLDSLKLQKDYINAIQPQWIDSMKSTVENYLSFQDKMIILYFQIWNAYLNNLFDIEKKNNNNKKLDK